jgi:hypothetical protein
MSMFPEGPGSAQDAADGNSTRRFVTLAIDRNIMNPRLMEYMKNESMSSAGSALEDLGSECNNLKYKRIYCKATYIL